MTNYLKNARHHAEKINHYYAHAGTAGHAQAHYHVFQLEKLLGDAYQSARGKQDVPIIQAILEGMRPKMTEMKRRESEGGA